MRKRLALSCSRLACRLCLGLALGAGTAAAATFEVAPVLLEMQGAQRVTSITVTNREDHPTTLQIRPMLWQQEQGQDGLSMTSDVQVSPPIFTVGPGESQLVRIFMRAATGSGDIGRELSYRLLIDEIPSPGQTSAVQMALRISIPLFVYAGRAGAPALQWKLLTDAKGPTWLSVSNQGNRRAKLATLVVTDDSGRRHDVGGAKSAYVLPGSQRLWRLEGWNQQAQPIKSATVSGVADSGEISAQAPGVPLE
jgi:fimbrial chaperone protein